MSIHKINTDGITVAATKIIQADDNINTAFKAVVTHGRNLENTWNSKAGTIASQLFDKLLQGNTSRSAVLQNHASTLQQVVAPNYVQSETTNKKLADLFL